MHEQPAQSYHGNYIEMHLYNPLCRGGEEVRDMEIYFQGVSRPWILQDMVYHLEMRADTARVSQFALLCSLVPETF